MTKIMKKIQYHIGKTCAKAVIASAEKAMKDMETFGFEGYMFRNTARAIVADLIVYGSVYAYFFA